MILGVTGSVQGATPAQYEVLERILSGDAVTELHHGDCIGVDAQAHELASARGLRTHVHPPSDSKKRAFCPGSVCSRPKLYLTRNKDIAQACDVVIGFPTHPQEVLRSGVWATMRHALKSGKLVYVVWPDGTLRRVWSCKY